MTSFGSLKKPLKLSELLNGTSFELNSFSGANLMEEECDEMMWDFDNEDLENYANPCNTKFSEWQSKMESICEGVYKKVLKEPKEGAAMIDLKRHRVVCHRNMYVEDETYPFDSTYMNGKAEEVCLISNDEEYLEGFLDALESMKEGEQSLFLVSYKKMFKELGCPPRIKEKADILIDLKVLKVTDIGDQEAINKLLKEKNELKLFGEIKDSLEETLARASDLFSQVKFSQALKLYQQSLHFASVARVSSEDEEGQRKSLVKRIHSNIAICFNKKEDWNSALIHVEAVDSYESIEEIPKMLFTKGLALMKLGETNEAKKFLLKAQKLKPLDAQINKAIKELKDRISSYKTFCTEFANNLSLKK